MVNLYHTIFKNYINSTDISLTVYSHFKVFAAMLISLFQVCYDEKLHVRVFSQEEKPSHSSIILSVIKEQRRHPSVCRKTC